MMETEIEAKFLDTNHDKFREKLKALGAECLHQKRSMKRKNFDFLDGRLQKIDGWVRVRDEGNKVTLSYKQLNDRSLHGTKEVNLVVNDFELTCKFLESIGMKQTSYQETERESWLLNGVSVELDQWPWIKPFIEIEASTEDLLKQALDLLKLNPGDAIHGSVENAYQAEFDVTDEEVDYIPEIIFGPVPHWLDERRLK